MDAEPDEVQPGGPSVAGEIRGLAEAAIVGIPVIDLIRTEDADERALLLAVRVEALNVLDDVLSNLARKIVNEYAEAKKRGSASKSG